MSPLQADYATGGNRAAPPAEPRGKRGADATVDASVSTWMCLVLSADGQRRRRLLDLTDAAGWRPIECDSVSEAVRQADRWKTHLAVLDLLGLAEPHRETFRKFAERLSQRPDPLLMICDDEASADELWARQLGAWLYLPEPELGEDLMRLCVEALRAAEKQQAAANPKKATVAGDAR